MKLEMSTRRAVKVKCGQSHPGTSKSDQDESFWPLTLVVRGVEGGKGGTCLPPLILSASNEDIIV